MKTRLTEENKIYILMNYHSKSQGRLAEILDRSRSTIKNFWYRWLKNKTISNGRSPGRPKKLAEYKLRMLEKHIRKTPTDSRSRIIEKLGLGCSPQTLSKYLHKMGFRKFKKIKKPLVIHRHQKERLQWAKKYRNWTYRQWKKVLFSDESSVELWKKYTERVWRKPGEALRNGMYQPTKLDFGKKYQKVWSVFSYKGVGKLVFLEDRWCGNSYRDILQENLIREGRRLIGSQFIYQQDGDTVHTCKKAVKWLKTNRVQTLDWCACAGDMNPIGKSVFI
jgi:transposase